MESEWYLNKVDLKKNRRVANTFLCFLMKNCEEFHELTEFYILEYII